MFIHPHTRGELGMLIYLAGWAARHVDESDIHTPSWHDTWL